MNTPLRRIVAGIATLDSHDPALAPAVRLAEQTGADLHLVHVYAPDAHVSPTPGPRDPAVVRGAALAGSLAARLEALARTLTQRDRITFQALPGRPGDVLPRLAASVGADLLVLGRSRRGGAAAAVLGTTAQRVLRASTIPVLALHSDTAPATHDRVLLTSDLSAHSAHALDTGVQIARALAHPFTPTLRPLFVTVPSYQAAVAGLPDRSVEDAARDVAEFLAEVPELAGASAAVRVGDPADEILAEAERWQADLVVMGTHGRRGLPRLLLGSVAETVMRRADTSVLVIPPPAASRHPGAEPAAAIQAETETGAEVVPAIAIEITTAFRRQETTLLARPIVVATDLSSASDHVLRSAAAAARASGAPLHVVHALGVGSAYGRRVDRVVLHDRIAAAEGELRAQVGRAVPHEVVVAEQRVEIGSPPRAIADYVDRVRPSLVVVGAHTHHGSYLGVLGSTTDRLIRTLRVPCLVVRTELGVPLRRVVVPVDLSAPSRTALEIGVRWAGALGGHSCALPLPETELAVLHVLPRLYGSAQPAFDRATVAPGLNAELERAVSAAGSPANVSVREDVLWNDQPANEIVSFAWRECADLVVLATHGHGPVRRALIGSTAASVLRRVPCPVLVVPPPARRGGHGRRAELAAESARPLAGVGS